MRFAGVVGRDAAEALRGTVLSAPPLDDPEALWVHELIGARVVDARRRRARHRGRGRGQPGQRPARARRAADWSRCVHGGVRAGRLTVDVPPGLLDEPGPASGDQSPRPRSSPPPPSRPRDPPPIGCGAWWWCWPWWAGPCCASGCWPGRRGHLDSDEATSGSWPGTCSTGTSPPSTGASTTAAPSRRPWPPPASQWPVRPSSPSRPCPCSSTWWRPSSLAAGPAAARGPGRHLCGPGLLGLARRLRLVVGPGTRLLLVGARARPGRPPAGGPHRRRGRLAGRLARPGARGRARLVDHPEHRLLPRARRDLARRGRPPRLPLLPAGGARRPPRGAAVGVAQPRAGMGLVGPPATAGGPGVPGAPLDVRVGGPPDGAEPALHLLGALGRRRVGDRGLRGRWSCWPPGR